MNLRRLTPSMSLLIPFKAAVRCLSCFTDAAAKLAAFCSATLVAAAASHPFQGLDTIDGNGQRSCSLFMKLSRVRVQLSAIPVTAR
jgi:hypothetical protein